MHDGAEIIGSDIFPVTDMLIEIMPRLRVDVRPEDLDIQIAVDSALLVPEPQSMPNFMDRIAF